MLDENLPTYRLQPSSDNPFHTLLYFTHNGSEPSPEYLLKRPSPAESRNQYALGLLDIHYASVIYAEVLVKPEWTQPTLSAAEVRAQNGAATTVPIMPESFNVLLYNPDQAIAIKRNQGSWKSDSWDFEVPEQSFKTPSTSQIDKDTGPALAELAPKVVFRWKRDGRLSKDMTCYMSGRSVGGKKNKEPDITVALFRAGKNEGTVTIYEPNMARVDVEDRKGLEVVLILSAEVIRDLYLVPKQDPFNTSGGSLPATVSNIGRRKSSPQPQQQQQQQQYAPVASGALGPGPVGGAGGNAVAGPSHQQANVDAETKRIQAMVAEENRQAREREKRDQEEQKRIRKMLEKEEQQQRRQDAEIEQETERLRRQYGVQGPPPVASGANGGYPVGPSLQPQLPPRHNQNTGWFASPGPQPGLPPRPNSVGPPGYGPRPDVANQNMNPNANGGKKKHSGPLGALLGPHSGPSGASVSSFFHRDGKKIEKKRSF